MRENSLLIEEARKGTAGYSESELRWLAKQLADALEAAETRTTELEGTAFIHEGCRGIRERDNAYLIGRAERAEAQLAAIRAWNDSLGHDAMAYSTQLDAILNGAEPNKYRDYDEQTGTSV